MTDTTHGLPDDVLELAAGKIVDRFGGYISEGDDVLEEILPILTPAIERALIDAIIYDLHESCEARANASGHEYTGLTGWEDRCFELVWRRYPTHDLPAKDWVDLPTATKGADHE